ncbi:MAG: hypothetical protein V4577_11555 [Bacteroidota bacterium]
MQVQLPPMVFFMPQTKARQAFELLTVSKRQLVEKSENDDR